MKETQKQELDSSSCITKQYKKVKGIFLTIILKVHTLRGFKFLFVGLNVEAPSSNAFARPENLTLVPPFVACIECVYLMRKRWLNSIKGEKKNRQSHP